MATYDLAFATRLDGVVVLQTFVETGIQVGDSVVIAGAPSGMSGTFTVLSTSDFEYIGQSDEGDFEYNYEFTITNQILVKSNFDDYQRAAATGTVTWTQSCTWLANIAPVEEFLGIDGATANDTAFLTTCIAAANAWCFRRRVQAGYHDSLTTVPDGSVLLGTTLYAAGLYRERGTTGDSYASFQDMSGPPLMTLGRVNQLLGVKRSQCA